MKKLTSDYWTTRYQQKETGWDLNAISPPLKEYIDSLVDKTITILIPGCGFGYEGAYLNKLGFNNVHLLDFSPEPLAVFAERNPQFPTDQLHVEDFFEHQGKYDLILEQTLFCALDPQLRSNYAKKAASLLASGGKLVGLLFDKHFEGGPPFGGSKEEYQKYFDPLFSEVKMEACTNSIAPRQGSELFIQLTK